jgi:hypothetical protein
MPAGPLKEAPLGKPPLPTPRERLRQRPPTSRPGGPTDDELRAALQQRLMESIGLSVEALQKILAPEIAHQALAAADC